jgi:hypothetical protein
MREGEDIMEVQCQKGFGYELPSIIQNAPTQSGIFAIFSWEQCLFVGESEDICASLLEIFYEANPCLTRKHLTHFIFELAPPESRVVRLKERIRELEPACNLGMGSPDCKYCRLAQGIGQGGLIRVPAPF